MTKTVNREDIMSKVRKLWEHMEGAQQIGSEEEANTAAALMQKMLMKHNISMEELQDSMTDAQKADNTVVEEAMSYYTKRSIGGSWERQLMGVIADWNLCKLLYNRHTKMMWIYGKKQNVDMCKYLHGMLKERYVKFSKEKFTLFRATLDWLVEPIGLDTFQRRYLLGCCDGLNAKFRNEDYDARIKDKEFDTQCTALVVRNTAAIDEYIQEKVGNVKVGRSEPDIRKGKAWRQGYDDGRNTTIQTPLNHSEAKNSKLLS